MNEARLTGELVEISAARGERAAGAARAATAIRNFGGYRWVGIYDVGADEISLVGFDGPGAPTHPRFPRTDGLCGAAVANRQTVIVADVTSDVRYLTTHPTTRSEIVVPVFVAGTPVGLIDVESERPQAFGERDQQLLERCAALISPLWGLSHRDAHDVGEEAS